MTRYIALDTETGGLDSDTSLMTLSLIIADNDLKVLDSLYLETIPNDGKYVVSIDALKINKLNISEMNPVSYKEAGTKIYDFLQKWYNNEEKQLIPLGKNTFFDINKIFNTVISKNSWENFCSYKIIDLSSIYQFLVDSKKMEPLPKNSLSDLAEHFDIPLEAHNAYNDALASLQIYQKMLALINE